MDVPAFTFAMIDGTMKPGDTPQTSLEFQEAIGALYGISFTLKFMSKQRKDDPIDYTVMALEGLWWTASGELSFDKVEDWQWTLMIMQPEHITVEMFQEALQQFKRKRDSPALSKLRLERFHEGLCIQIMRVGPYATEPAIIEKMEAFAQEYGCQYRGKHHEFTWAIHDGPIQRGYARPSGNRSCKW